MKLSWKNIKTLIITLFIFFSSCSIISINSTGYKFLSQKEKSTLCNYKNFSDTCSLVIIDPTELRQLLASSKGYNLLLLWTPSCNSDLTFTHKLEQDYSFVKLWIVSVDYSIDKIRKSINQSNYKGQIFLIPPKYGNNISILERDFIYDLCGYKMKSTKMWRDTTDVFLFFADSLITAGPYNVINKLNSIKN